MTETSLNRLRSEFAELVGEPSVLGCLLAATRAARRGSAGAEQDTEQLARRLLEQMRGDCEGDGGAAGRERHL